MADSYRYVRESSSEPSSAMTNAQQLEIKQWEISELERPGAEFMPCMVTKMAEFGPVFLDAIERYRDVFVGAADVLELGGGQGWASCMIKSRYPNARVVATDISPHALETLPKWENVFGVRLDERSSCLSSRIPYADASFDVVFAFAAAHHFRTHKQTLLEIARVLRDGGSCLYLYEPSCHPAIYSLALWRVERKRPTPPEDVMRYSDIASIASQAGLQCTVKLNLNQKGRGPIETLYYLLFRRFPGLLWFLPCTMDYLFTKDARV